MIRALISKVNARQNSRGKEMEAAQKKAMFLAGNEGAVSDKWCAMNTDRTEQTIKHCYGGAVQAANMINWELVMVDENDDGELAPVVFDI